MPGGIVRPRDKDGALIAGNEWLHLCLKGTARCPNQQQSIISLDRLQCFWQLLLQSLRISLQQKNMCGIKLFKKQKTYLL